MAEPRKPAKTIGLRPIASGVPIPVDVRIIGSRGKGWPFLFEKMEVGEALPLADDEVRGATASALAFQKKREGAFEFSVGRATDPSSGREGAWLWRTR